MENIDMILAKLPLEMQKEIYYMEDQNNGYIEEIRIRCGSPVIIRLNGKEFFLKGKYGQSIGNKTLQDIFNSIMNHSAYAYQNQLANGYITIEGGHRVGVCGRVVKDGDIIKGIKDISSLNLRRSREIIGISDKLLPRLFDDKGRFLHTILISPPMCGKTTLLRDIIRNLSELGLRVAVCDERSEIAGSSMGVPSFNLGHRTDVLDGCTKSQGMMMLIRGMSPDVIATDEIGRAEDLYAVEGALCAGVGLLTTIHGNSYEELLRSKIGSLVSSRIFKRYIYLTNQPKIGTVSVIADENNLRLNCV